MDLSPPAVIFRFPDSAATNVSRHPVFRVEFSERMNRRSVEDYVFTSPPIRFADVSWEGNTLILAPDSLRPGTTYLAVIGTGAQDAHGNPLARSCNLLFSTGAALDSGRVVGQVQAVGQSAAGLLVWLYDASRPDSAWGSQDPDYIGQTGSDGRFEVPGLRVGRDFTVHLFADLTRDRSFDPATEYMLHVPGIVHLTALAPQESLPNLRYADPSLPASLAGRFDTTGFGRMLRLRVEAPADTSARFTVRPDSSRSFRLQQAPAGRYRIYWFDDSNENDEVPWGSPGRGPGTGPAPGRGRGGAARSALRSPGQARSAAPARDRACGLHEPDSTALNEHSRRGRTHEDPLHQDARRR